SSLSHFLFSSIRPPPTSTLFPYTTLFRSQHNLFENIFENQLEFVAAKTCDGIVVDGLSAREPHKIDVFTHRFLYLSAGIDVIHIGINHYFEHHFRMITWMTFFAISF